jgi:hypothetical protein
VRVHDGEVGMDGDDATGEIHVYPTYGREHDTEGADCWCSPTSEDYRGNGGSRLVIHREAN